MDDLTYTLTLISRQLRELGFRQMRASSLKGKHVETLLALWQSEGLAAGTQKNRMVYVRWWAEKVGKAGIIPADNAQLAIPDRQFVTNENKARQLGQSLGRVSDAHVRMSLPLIEIEIQKGFAVGDTCIRLPSNVKQQFRTVARPPRLIYRLQKLRQIKAHIGVVCGTPAHRPGSLLTETRRVEIGMRRSVVTCSTRTPAAQCLEVQTALHKRLVGGAESIERLCGLRLRKR